MPLTTFHFGAAIDALCQRYPEDRPALIHAGRAVSYPELGRRTDALAAALSDQGLPRGAHVGHYMRNRPEYLESALACAKAGLTHVNVNYRYKDEELAHAFRSLDVAAVIYAREFAGQAARLRELCPELRVFVELDARPSPANAFAEDYEALASRQAGGFTPRFDDEDYVIIATGGTTGLPKGVMWRNAELWASLRASDPAIVRGAWTSPPATLKEHVENVLSAEGRYVFAPFSPLMHGVAFMTSLAALARGGAVATLAGERFDALDALRQAKAAGATTVSLVGDAFALPVAEALEAHAEEDLLGAVEMLTSSGAAFSPSVKARILAQAPHLTLMDFMGSSEAPGTGTTVTTRNTPSAEQGAPAFGRGIRDIVILDEARRPLPPGSEKVGWVAIGGPLPLGYYNDPEKTAQTFVTVDGRRYAAGGDMGSLDREGVLTFHGRGSACINTGGEKVFAEEVEGVLKRHPAVRDALVFGAPDPRFGERIVAVVQADGPADPAELRAHVRERLADYKAPREVVVTTEPLRGPNGKADYGLARRLRDGSGSS